MSRLLIEAQKILQINSMSHFGNEELNNYLISLFQEAGIEYKIQHVTHSLGDDVSKRQFNILGIFGDPLVDRKTKKGLLLLSHLDTVGPGNVKAWSQPPYSGAIHDGYLYGVGAATKVDFLCKLFAAKKMKEQKQKMPIYLAGVCGHHLGYMGARYLLESNALNPRYIYIGHPTDSHIGRSHPGSQNFKIKIHFHTVEKDARGFNRGLKIYFNGDQKPSQLPVEQHAINNMLNLINDSIERGFELRIKEMGGGEYTHLSPHSSSCILYFTAHQFEDFKRFLREKEKIIKEEAGYHSFQVEYGALGESGVSFLPQTFFPCLTYIKNNIEEYVNDSQNCDDIKINFGKIKCNNRSIELSFEATEKISGIKSEPLFKEIVKNASSQYPKLNVELSIGKKTQAYFFDDSSRLVNLSQELLESYKMSKDCIDSQVPTIAGYCMSKNYETVFFGVSPLSENLFQPDEKISVEKIQFAYDYYSSVIERICL